jgi:hypothetical protein
MVEKDQFADPISMNILKVAYGKMLGLQQNIHMFVVYVHLIINVV